MDNFNKLIADLGSWYWWLSVVVIGLAINLASSYMKPWLGAAFSIDSRETKPLLLMAIALAMPFLTLVGLDPPESRGRIVAVSCCGGVAIGFVMRLSAS